MSEVVVVISVVIGFVVETRSPTKVVLELDIVVDVLDVTDAELRVVEEFLGPTVFPETMSRQRKDL